MKSIVITLSVLAAAMIFWFCKSTKHRADSLPARQLRWGGGGGFTGKETSFALLENGQIFKTANLGEAPGEIGGTKAKTAKGLFASAESLGLKTIQYDNPGNITYFLEIRDETTTHRINWGGTGAEVDSKVMDFYKVLQQLVAEAGR